MTPTTKYRWAETNSPVASSRTDDISFIDRQTGWSVNSNGQVSMTTDGGNTWTVQLTVNPQGPGRPYLRSIDFSSRTRGWFGALLTSMALPPDYQNLLLQSTEDGGKTWFPAKNLPAGSPQGICGLSVIGDSVVYAAGTNDPNLIGPGVLKTTDVGSTWELIDMSPYATNLIDIRFFDENRGFVVGGKASDRCTELDPAYRGSPQYGRVKPVVLYTEDGGKSWVDRVACMDFACGEWGWKLFWVDDQVGFVSLENFVEGNVLRTLDGGQTWEKFHVNDRRPLTFGEEVSNANLEGIGFVDRDFGWVGGWGDARFIGTYNSVTQNGGRGWKAEDFAVNAGGSPVGDVRLNVNRYQFFGDPVDAGYCSGKRVYKLMIEGSPEALAALAPVREEPETPNFDLSDRLVGEQRLAIHYKVPKKAARVQMGLWNQFGFHFRTLVEETDVAAGEKTVEWDGRDDNGKPNWPGAVICRLTIDGETESETFHLR